MKFSIFSKLLLGFSTVLLLTGLIAGLGVYDLGSLSSMTNSIIGGPEKIKYLARHAESQLHYAVAEEKEFLALQDQSNAQKFVTSAKEARALAEKITALSTDSQIQADAKELAVRIDKYVKGFNDVLSEIYVKASGNEAFATVMQRETSIQVLYQQYSSEATAAEKLSNAIVAQADKQAEIARTHLADESASTRLVLIIIAAIAIGIGFILAFVISRILAHPILKLNNAAQRVASGEHGVTIDIRTNDELQELGTAFNRMVTSIDGMVDNLNKSNTDITRILGEANIAKESSEAGKHSLEDEVLSLGRLIEAIFLKS
jgi:methyl-accepting chemotaxis protein